MTSKPMTVGKLRELLAAYDDDVLIRVCIGDKYVTVDEYDWEYIRDDPQPPGAFYLGKWEESRI